MLQNVPCSTPTRCWLVIIIKSWLCKYVWRSDCSAARRSIILYSPICKYTVTASLSGIFVWYTIKCKYIEHYDREMVPTEDNLYIIITFLFCTMFLFYSEQARFGEMLKFSLIRQNQFGSRHFHQNYKFYSWNKNPTTLNCTKHKYQVFHGISGPSGHSNRMKSGKEHVFWI